MGKSKLKEKLEAIAKADTDDLRKLAEIAGYDPVDFYEYVDMAGADLRGQDLRGMKFKRLDLSTVKIDSKTRLPDEFQVDYQEKDNNESDFGDIDILAEYRALSAEIDKRFMATSLARMQPGAVPLEETLDDPEFRRRAAAVFRDILETVRKDEQEGRARKIDPISLFNIAAKASMMDMDFVALELMERANEYANGPWLEDVLEGRTSKVQLHAVEAAARYVRQLLNMRRITPEEALKAIKVVLANTNEFDLHLVASEAFNIGQRIADPAGMADVIEQNLPKHLRDVSYVKLNGARLKFMGGLPEQVQKGEKIFLYGLKRFGQEPPTARWFKHSAQELADIMTENPELVLRHAEKIRQAIRKQPNARVFERVYGRRLMEALQEFGWLNDFLDEPWEKGDRGHEKSEEEFRRAFLEALLRNNDDDEKP